MPKCIGAPDQHSDHDRPILDSLATRTPCEQSASVDGNSQDEQVNLIDANRRMEGHYYKHCVEDAIEQGAKSDGGNAECAETTKFPEGKKGKRDHNY